ncbi:LysM domain-containing protein [Mucilaginibacter sp. SMC90]|uniref:LysM peptidoglycan-binding domain-containing protein n=1 Tax=Mucilaginibacter sp. SMC90 TaxID=2929803 RepID=UPI001FB544BF|nr:LysM domain-containing protein [Mucilaginibacter sp. SMC90]UOE47972.1 LysM domain-containing protein [Mucilaginibacter sp. SMC90]
MPNNKIVKAGQSLGDIAVQYGGTAENRFILAALNGIGITDALTSGQLIDAGDVTVFAVADYFRKYNISPATSAMQIDDLAPEGVEFWAIEYDFIVS